MRKAILLVVITATCAACGENPVGPSEVRKKIVKVEEVAKPLVELPREVPLQGR